MNSKAASCTPIVTVSVEMGYSMIAEELVVKTLLVVNRCLRRVASRLPWLASSIAPTHTLKL